MRLQTEQRAITAHRALGDAGDRGGRAHAPLGGVVGLALHHQVNQFRHFFIVVSARAPRPQFVVQTGKSAVLITAAPVANRRSADPATPRHLPVGVDPVWWSVFGRNGKEES